MVAKMGHVGLIPIIREFIFWHGFGFIMPEPKNIKNNPQNIKF
jgi:hypothetical protein